MDNKNAWNNALFRGSLRKAEILNRKDMLSLNDFTNKFNFDSLETVKNWINCNKILALPKDNGGYVLPVQQMDMSMKPLPGLNQLIMALKDPWWVYLVLEQKYIEFDELSGWDMLHQDCVDKLILVEMR